jgi:TonB family protein
MLFARLIESQQRAALASRAMVEGAGVSAGAHALLIVGWLLLHQGAGSLAPSRGSETFTPVEFLLPRDRLSGTRPQRETVTFTTLQRRAGDGFAQDPEPPPPPDEPRLEIVVPPGNSKELEVAMKEFESQPPLILGDSIMMEFQVDSAVVRYEDGAAPTYPESLLRRRIEGSVIVQYVVDTLGRADTATFRVISTTHPEFARAVKQTLPQMRFRPATMANKHVAQLVQQPFAFRIVDTTRVRTRPPPEESRQSRLPAVTSSQ